MIAGILGKVRPPARRHLKACAPDNDFTDIYNELILAHFDAVRGSSTPTDTHPLGNPFCQHVLGRPKNSGALVVIPNAGHGGKLPKQAAGDYVQI